MFGRWQRVYLICQQGDANGLLGLHQEFDVRLFLFYLLNVRIRGPDPHLPESGAATVTSTPARKEPSMPLCFPMSVLAIALIYYSWRDGYCGRLLHDKALRERVAYMLWTTAHHCA